MQLKKRDFKICIRKKLEKKKWKKKTRSVLCRVKKIGKKKKRTTNDGDLFLCTVYWNVENLHFWSFSICSLPRIELKTKANGVSKRKDRKKLYGFFKCNFLYLQSWEKKLEGEKKLCWSSPQNRVIQQITGWTNNLITIEILPFFSFGCYPSAFTTIVTTPKQRKKNPNSPTTLRTEVFLYPLFSP